MEGPAVDKALLVLLLASLSGALFFVSRMSKRKKLNAAWA